MIPSINSFLVLSQLFYNIQRVGEYPLLHVDGITNIQSFLF
jgi:hypothetical protein